MISCTTSRLFEYRGKMNRTTKLKDIVKIEIIQETSNRESSKKHSDFKKLSNPEIPLLQ